MSSTCRHLIAAYAEHLSSKCLGFIGMQSCYSSRGMACRCSLDGLPDRVLTSVTTSVRCRDMASGMPTRGQKDLSERLHATE